MKNDSLKTIDGELGKTDVRNIKLDMRFYRLNWVSWLSSSSSSSLPCVAALQSAWCPADSSSATSSPGGRCSHRRRKHRGRTATRRRAKTVGGCRNMKRNASLCVSYQINWDCSKHSSVTSSRPAPPITFCLSWTDSTFFSAKFCPTSAE